MPAMVTVPGMARTTSSATRALPPAGAYRLTIRLSRPLRLRVGALGTVSLPAGLYYYCGSARRALPARVARHLRRRKPKRWHVDYLLAHPAAVVCEVRAWAGRTECELAVSALRCGGRALIAGFGSNDCRSGCPAHLLYMGPGAAGNAKPGPARAQPI